MALIASIRGVMSVTCPVIRRVAHRPREMIEDRSGDAIDATCAVHSNQHAVFDGLPVGILKNHVVVVCHRPRDCPSPPFVPAELLKISSRYPADSGCLTSCGGAGVPGRTLRFLTAGPGAGCSVSSPRLSRSRSPTMRKTVSATSRGLVSNQRNTCTSSVRDIFDITLLLSFLRCCRTKGGNRSLDAHSVRGVALKRYRMHSLLLSEGPGRVPRAPRVGAQAA
jgi:hypothetical protein